MYGDPAKMLNNLATCNSGESEKNIYAEHINFNKETQIVTMDHIFLSESYEIFMPLMACVRESRNLLRRENNFALIYYYWWGSEIAIALEFDANGSRITANPKAENLTIADAFSMNTGKHSPKNFIINRVLFDTISRTCEILPDENSSSGSFNTGTPATN